MSDTIEKIRYRSCTIAIKQDDNPENPRSFDNLGTMVCWHRRYNLGDKHSFSDPDEFRDWWKRNGKGGILFGLYLYDHSGITIRQGHSNPFNCGWDSCFVGYHYVTAADMRKNWMSKRVSPKMRKMAENVLEAETSTYDDYLTGAVYGFTVKYPGSTSDSCWGYYGHNHEESGLLDEARSYIDHHISQKMKDHTIQLKIWITHHVPLDRRKPMPVF